MLSVIENFSVIVFYIITNKIITPTINVINSFIYKYDKNKKYYIIKNDELTYLKKHYIYVRWIHRNKYGRYIIRNLIRKLNTLKKIIWK